MQQLGKQLAEKLLNILRDSDDVVIMKNEAHIEVVNK